jgi:beta-glucosidase-like glycosyl hydrolase/CubicO group peptidase (beta-lactamase class C family)
MPGENLSISGFEYFMSCVQKYSISEARAMHFVGLKTYSIFSKKRIPMRTTGIVLLVCFLTGIQMPAQARSNVLPVDHPWVDSVFKTLSQQERIAQLFMVAAYSNKDVKYEQALLDQISEYKLGGVIFFQGDPLRQAKMTNRLQGASPVPLLVGMDAEWGLAMRLENTIRFPYHMTLGAVQEPYLIYETGRAIGRQCRRLGVHINFAPVADINNNPENPVINFRSFGSDREEVAWRVHEFAAGLRDAGILPVVKHFPGHGDTNADSHHTLPVISHARDRLDSVELFPFRFAIETGIEGVMVAHLNVPALDNTGVPTSLSSVVLDGLLRNTYGYEGLIFTDALNMRGVQNNGPAGSVELAAFIAGNDVLLFPENVEAGISAIEQAVRTGIVDLNEVDKRCRRVLAAKLLAGLDKQQLVDTTRLLQDLHTPEDRFLNHRLAEGALTLLENKGVLPIGDVLDTVRIAAVALGSDSKTAFQEGLDRYAHVAHFMLPYSATAKEYAMISDEIQQYDLIILGVHGMKVYPGNNFGIPSGAVDFIQRVAEISGSIITIFGNPYFVQSVPGIEEASGLLVAYQETDALQDVASQAIFGALGCSGKLPVQVEGLYDHGYGVDTKGGIRLGYSVPEAAGIPSSRLEVLDSIAHNAVRAGATPGCVVLVAKDMKVIYEKAYGYHTYDSIVPAQKDHLYDLASITKIAGALPALMKLYGEGKIELDDPISRYATFFRNSAAGDLTFREVLAHQSGLMAWIPFWKGTLRGNARYPWKKRWRSNAVNEGSFKWATFKSDSSRRFPVRVTDDLWLHKKYRNKIYRAIKKSPVGEKGYLYSGLVFFVFPHIIEEITGMDYVAYLEQNFYDPLGAYDLTYHPLPRRHPSHIAPTERDTLFRQLLVHGAVHDEGAAMMECKSSNAGLFSTANDLAKLMQMYLNGGGYGGRQYVAPATVVEFTRCQYCENGNGRGLGFDRQRNNGNTARSASDTSFGHSGFTGTYTWVDPESNLLYVFLSNRVYPSRDNTLLLKMDVRTNILQAIYEAMDRRNWQGKQ